MTALTARDRLESRSVLVPLCGCRMFFGAGTPAGYGVLHYQGRQQYAHRVAYELQHGPIPAGALVLHECDNPACINTSHLFLGTSKDNTQDMLRKGRCRAGAPTGDRNPMRVHQGLMAGEKSPAAKLTAAQVQAIRDRHAQGETQSSLAREFHVRQGHISRIIRRTAWA